MSGLLGSLSVASQSLIAQRMGLDVVGQNIANINTPGYSRRALDLGELPPIDPFSAGRGVTVEGIRALRDEFVEARLRRQHTDTSHDTALEEMLATAEAVVGLPGNSLDAALTAFFDAFAALASDPTSAVARDLVSQQGQGLASAFHGLVNEFTRVRDTANDSIRAGVQTLNDLATELSQLNVDMATASYDAESIRDRQLLLLGEMGKLADIAVLRRDDGGVDVTLTSGRALVIGDVVYPLTLSGNPASIFLEGVDVTSEFNGGRIGGLLDARDQVIPGYLGDLDQLAYDIATAINGVHITGFDALGSPAGDFFTAPAGVAGAAAALGVDAAIVADSRRVAASGTGAIGDNAIARALAGLRQTNISGGGTRTAFGAWSQFMYAVGADVAQARAAADSHEQIATQLEALRAQTSGVSYDEEAAHLMRYQRAYEANARYFQSVLSALDALMEMVE